MIRCKIMPVFRIKCKIKFTSITSKIYTRDISEISAEKYINETNYGKFNEDPEESIRIYKGLVKRQEHVNLIIEDIKIILNYLKYSKDEDKINVILNLLKILKSKKKLDTFEYGVLIYAYSSCFKFQECLVILSQMLNNNITIDDEIIKSVLLFLSQTNKTLYAVKLLQFIIDTNMNVNNFNSMFFDYFMNVGDGNNAYYTIELVHREKCLMDLNRINRFLKMSTLVYKWAFPVDVLDLYYQKAFETRNYEFFESYINYRIKSRPLSDTRDMLLQIKDKEFKEKLLKIYIIKVRKQSTFSNFSAEIKMFQENGYWFQDLFYEHDIVDDFIALYDFNQENIEEFKLHFDKYTPDYLRNTRMEFILHQYFKKYANLEQIHKADKMLYNFYKLGLKLEQHIFYYVLNFYAKLNQESLALNLIKFIDNTESYKQDVFIYEKLILLYRYSNCLDKALEIYNELLRKGISPNIGIYTSMIYLYLRHGKKISAEAIFDNILASKIYPTQQIIDIFIKDKFKFGGNESPLIIIESEILLQFVKKFPMNSIRLNTDHVQYILNYIVKENKMQIAEDFLKWAVDHFDIILEARMYQLLLLGYCINGRMQAAENIISKMATQNLQFDSYSYSCLITAYFIQGNHNRASELLFEMKINNISYDIVHLTPFISLSTKLDKNLLVHNKFFNFSNPQDVFGSMDMLINRFYQLQISIDGHALARIIRTIYYTGYGISESVKFYQKRFDMFSEFNQPMIFILKKFSKHIVFKFLTISDPISDLEVEETQEDMEAASYKDSITKTEKEYNEILDLWDRLENEKYCFTNEEYDRIIMISFLMNNEQIFCKYYDFCEINSITLTEETIGILESGKKIIETV